MEWLLFEVTNIELRKQGSGATTVFAHGAKHATGIFTTTHGNHHATRVLVDIGGDIVDFTVYNHPAVRGGAVLLDIGESVGGS